MRTILSPPHTKYGGEPQNRRILLSPGNEKSPDSVENQSFS